MKRVPMPAHSPFLGAFSMVEVVLAVGIIAFGLIGVFALLPSGVVAAQEGKAQEEATDLLEAATVELRTAHDRRTKSPVYALDANDKTNQSVTLDRFGVVAEANDAAYLLTVRRLTNSAFTGPAFHVSVSWPPTAASPTGWVECVAVLPSEPTGL